MADIFEFAKLPLDQLNELKSKSWVFNVSREALGDLEVVENAFDMEEFGSSVESVDIFVDSVDNSLTDIEEHLDKRNFFAPNKEVGGGVYTFGGMMALLDTKEVSFCGILVVNRIMSDLILDKTSGKIGAVYYNICTKDVYSFLAENPAVDGYVARRQLRLTDDYRNQIKDILLQDKEQGVLTELRFNIFMEALN